MGVVLSPLPGALSPCPASVPLTQRGSRDFPLLRALQGRQPWGLLFSMARPLPLLQHCPFPGTLRSERTEMSIWGEAGNRAGTGGQSQSLLEQQRPLGKRNSPGGREGDDVPARFPLVSFLLLIHPLPHPQVVFTQFFCFPSSTPVPDCGGGGGTRRGFQVAGCL